MYWQEEEGGREPNKHIGKTDSLTHKSSRIESKSSCFFFSRFIQHVSPLLYNGGATAAVATDNPTRVCVCFLVYDYNDDDDLLLVYRRSIEIRHKERERETTTTTSSLSIRTVKR